MKKLEEIVQALDGLTYVEWTKLKGVVERKYAPDMGKVKLADTEGLLRMLKLEMLGVIP